MISLRQPRPTFNPRAAASVAPVATLTSVLHRVLLPALVLLCLPVGAASGDVVIYASSDVPKVIPDDDATGIVSELFVPDSVFLTDVDLILDELLHEAVPDLSLELTSPSGTTVVLIRSSSEGGIFFGLGVRDNFVGTILDDQAPLSLTDAFFDNHVGSYNVDHPSVGPAPLSAFVGEDAAGLWVLRVSDRERFDTGALNAWSLQLTGTLVPEPSAMALLGLGLGVGAVARRRLRRGDR